MIQQGVGKAIVCVFVRVCVFPRGLEKEVFRVLCTCVRDVK